MNKNVFRMLVVATFVIAILSGVMDYFYATEPVNEFYRNYCLKYTETEIPLYMSTMIYAGVAMMLVSIIGMLLFWHPSRFLYIVSYIILLPGYYLGPPLTYLPTSKILYDIGMIGSGVILAVMYLEPINSLFNKNRTNI